MASSPMKGARAWLRHRVLLRKVRKTTDWHAYKSLIRSTGGSPHGRTVANLLLWRAHAESLETLLRSQSARLQEAARKLSEFEAKEDW